MPRTVIKCRGPAAQGGPRVAVLEHCPHCGHYHPHVMVLDGSIQELRRMGELLAREERERQARADDYARQTARAHTQARQRHEHAQRELARAQEERIRRERFAALERRRQIEAQADARRADNARDNLARKERELSEAIAMLGLRPDYGDGEVREALARFAMAHHPDRGGDPACMAAAGGAALLCREALEERKP